MADDEILGRCREVAGAAVPREDAAGRRPGHIRTHHDARSRRADAPQVGAGAGAETCALHPHRRVPGLQRRADQAGQPARRRTSQRLRCRRSRSGDLSVPRRDQRRLRSVPAYLWNGARQAGDHVGESALHAADPWCCWPTRPSGAIRPPSTRTGQLASLLSCARHGEWSCSWRTLWPCEGGLRRTVANRKPPS